MSLYNRNYANSHEQELAREYSQSSLSTFIKQTYQLFAASLLAASVGAYVGLGIAHMFIGNLPLFIGLVVVELGLLFGLIAAKRKAGLNLVLLFAFTFVSGLTLTPLLASVLAMPGGASIVAQAFTLTTVAFGALSVFAMNTKRDFTAMGKMLFITLIVVIVAAIMNLFFKSPIFQLVISSVSAILFSAYILYDTQNIIRGNYETPIEGAVALYLDFVNLFTSLLQILGILNRE
ncbi:MULTISPECIES: Bax inhibitor-1/YccA family protein [unclassified Campylobacter]|uniref:Bax inhibitor-1/YccA family protein n=1 Tax=unclassified Campylobacter TaxID=2593542 RepID=UPI001474C612|nr:MULTISPECIES: Bax inhibitor-1/YccA family protein [unclassified Campylobacter]